MTAEQQKGWEQFFGTVRDVKSQLNVQRADISGDVSSVLVTGSYTYVNGSTAPDRAAAGLFPRHHASDPVARGA